MLVYIMDGVVEAFTTFKGEFNLRGLFGKFAEFYYNFIIFGVLFMNTSNSVYPSFADRCVKYLADTMHITEYML